MWPSLYIGAGELSLGSHGWAEGTLPAKPSPQPAPAPISICTLLIHLGILFPEKQTEVEWGTHFALIWPL